MLLRAGARVSEVDSKLRTPLELAIFKNNVVAERAIFEWLNPQTAHQRAYTVEP
jgi:hypothetical protein